MTCQSGYCTCAQDQCAVEGSCIGGSTMSLAVVASPMDLMQTQNTVAHYAIGACLLLVGFSAMAFAAKLFRLRGDDSFVLMTDDVEQ